MGQGDGGGHEVCTVFGMFLGGDDLEDYEKRKRGWRLKEKWW